MTSSKPAKTVAAEIRFELFKRGLTLATVAKILGLSRPYVSRVISLDAQSKLVRDFIADVLGPAFAEMLNEPKRNSPRRRSPTGSKVARRRSHGQRKVRSPKSEDDEQAVQNHPRSKR